MILGPHTTNDHRLLHFTLKSDIISSASPPLPTTSHNGVSDTGLWLLLIRQVTAPRSGCLLHLSVRSLTSLASSRLRKKSAARRAKKEEDARVFEEQKIENARRVSRLSGHWDGAMIAKVPTVSANAPPCYETIILKGTERGAGGAIGQGQGRRGTLEIR